MDAQHAVGTGGICLKATRTDYEYMCRLRRKELAHGVLNPHAKGTPDMRHKDGIQIPAAFFYK